MIRRLVIWRCRAGACRSHSRSRAAYAIPDWPCQQIKVPEMSLGGGLVGACRSIHRTPPGKIIQAVADLVEKLAPRREPIEQAQTLHPRLRRSTPGIESSRSCCRSWSGCSASWTQERGSVMAGLDRFGARQKELAADIRADNEKLRALQADPACRPDSGATD